MITVTLFLEVQRVFLNAHQQPTTLGEHQSWATSATDGHGLHLAWSRTGTPAKGMELLTLGVEQRVRFKSPETYLVIQKTSNCSVKKKRRNQPWFGKLVTGPYSIDPYSDCKPCWRKSPNPALKIVQSSGGTEPQTKAATRSRNTSTINLTDGSATLAIWVAKKIWIVDKAGPPLSQWILFTFVLTVISHIYSGRNAVDNYETWRSRKYDP